MMQKKANINLRPFLFSLALLLVSVPGRGFAAFDEVSEFAGKTLDGIEDAVKDSFLVDAKKKLWKEHNLLIKPFFKFGYELSDNIFHQFKSTRADETDHSDNVWTFTPGLNFLHKNSYGVVGGAYEATFRYYTQFGDPQNHQDNKFLVYTNLFPTEKTYVRASERFERRGVIGPNSGTKPIEFSDNTVNAVIGYKEGPWQFEFGYENDNREFHNVTSKRFNRNEDKMDYRIYYNMNDWTRFYSGFQLGWADYDKFSSKDVTYWEIPLGVEGYLPFEIKLNASIGVHHRNYEHAMRNDPTHVVTNINLQRDFNDKKTNVSLGFVRRPVESNFSFTTYYDEKLWYANLKHLVTPKLRARAGISHANRDWEEAMWNGHIFNVGQFLFATPRSQQKRDDDLFSVQVGFDWQVRKWMIWHIDYKYEYRNSNWRTIDPFEGSVDDFLDYQENSLLIRSTIPL